MNPVDVGNGRRVLVTETAGRAGVELKGAALGLDLALGRVDGSASGAGEAVAPFVLESYRVITEHRADGGVVAQRPRRSSSTGGGSSPRRRATVR